MSLGAWAARCASTDRSVSWANPSTSWLKCRAGHFITSGNWVARVPETSRESRSSPGTVETLRATMPSGARWSRHSLKKSAVAR